LTAAAAEMKTGNLCIIDWRTPDPNGAVLPEDIIGAVEVKDGALVSRLVSCESELSRSNVARIDAPHAKSACVVCESAAQGRRHNK